MFLINLAITLFGGSRAKENGRCETIDYMNTYHTCVGLLLSSKVAIVEISYLIGFLANLYLQQNLIQLMKGKSCIHMKSIKCSFCHK